MVSKAMIILNFQRANAQAAKLEELAERLRKTGKNDIGSARAAQAAGWKGENQDALNRKVEQLESKVVTTANSLKKTADAIRRIAQNTYNAEMRAWELARRRTFR